jgi:hypothetical protein
MFKLPPERLLKALEHSGKLKVVMVPNETRAD